MGEYISERLIANTIANCHDEEFKKRWNITGTLDNLVVFASVEATKVEYPGDDVYEHRDEFHAAQDVALKLMVEGEK